VRKTAEWPIVELRRYTLHLDARDTLIELFDRELVESQERLGMRLLGQFRDLDDPDSFVWLRAFRDMDTRKGALEAFYSGAVWKQHSAAANATMIDSDNVLLLRPLAAIEPDVDRRAPRGSAGDAPGHLVVTIYPLDGARATAVPDAFLTELEPLLNEAGIDVLATYSTEHSENTFPALPVREGEVFVWMALFADEDEHARRLAVLDQAAWRRREAAALGPYLAGEPEVLRLRPTARSLIHG
jgi:quinol monooxygenase YgiN